MNRSAWIAACSAGLALLVVVGFRACATKPKATGAVPVLTQERIGLAVMNVLKVPTGTVAFSVSRKRPADADIYLNSNFFDARGPIGELIINGKRASKRVKGGGYFFVRGGVAGVSAKVAPKNPTYSTQSLIYGINDGKVNAKLFKKTHSKEPDYRTLVGTDASGDVYVIGSSRTALVTVEAIMNLGKQLGIQEAILPDAGSSVDYQLSDGVRTEAMKAMPYVIKKGLGKQEPKSYIVGRIER